MKKLIIAAVIIALTGCVTPVVSKVTATGSRELTASEKSYMTEAVKNKLIDPDSARITFVPFIETAENSLHYCAYVNSKNSYGGYSGNQIFKGTFLKVNGQVKGAVALIDSSQLGQEALRDECKEIGYSMY